MRINRYPAAIVVNRDERPAGIVAVKFDLDPVRLPGDGVVHRIVENFGNEMMQRSFISSANIHGGALAHCFMPVFSPDHLVRGPLSTVPTTV